MKVVRHGLSIGIEHSGKEFFMRMQLQGKLTHEDYEVIVPMLESAIAGVDHPQIKVFVDMTEFDGWELRAAWDDLKLGLKHGREFSKLAIVGHKDWLKYAAKVGAWFTGGKAEYFEDTDAALQWLCESPDDKAA